MRIERVIEDRWKIHLRAEILLVALFCSLAGFAANDKDTYFFQKVDYQQGLSNSAVLCLFQDNEGLMWFGTYDGMNCYDGKSMEVFRTDFSEDKTLSNNVIHYCTGRQQLLVGLYPSGSEPLLEGVTADCRQL